MKKSKNSKSKVRAGAGVKSKVRASSGRGRGGAKTDAGRALEERFQTIENGCVALKTQLDGLKKRLLLAEAETTVLLMQLRTPPPSRDVLMGTAPEMPALPTPPTPPTPEPRVEEAPSEPVAAG